MAIIQDPFDEGEAVYTPDLYTDDLGITDQPRRPIRMGGTARVLEDNADLVRIAYVSGGDIWQVPRSLVFRDRRRRPW